MGKKYSFLILAVVVFLTVSCEEDERKSLNVEERKEVNQKYKEVLDSINKTLIVECENNREQKFKTLVDSLKTARLEEILLITKPKGNDK